jgi:hypothetical protein
MLRYYRKLGRMEALRPRTCSRSGMLARSAQGLPVAEPVSLSSDFSASLGIETLLDLRVLPSVSVRIPPVSVSRECGLVDLTNPARQRHRSIMSQLSTDG